ncbi:hypothetical protein PVK06_003063 [Gossypium arboreum]|uniref:Uncharacterized protein n=1 Tax=Gossypium arboreum TaxID=29729 RepID=A0ABR0R5A0_GOSAR|nr:hypothetical protein PVK06_003063 [Gossypium arboreum]
MIDEVISLEVGDVIFSIRVRERGLSKLKEDNVISKASRKKKEEVSTSEASSVASTRPKIPSEGIENVKIGALMAVNLENGKKSYECQKMMEEENEEVELEHIFKEINLGKAAVTDNVLERALNDIRDMGLNVIEDALEVLNVGGIKNGSLVAAQLLKILSLKI